MSHGAIDPGAESRAGEGGARVARAGDQHGGSGCRFVARFWSVAASSLSLSRRGSGGRVSTCGRRSLGDDYPQDPEQHCTGVARLLRAQRADHERDRTTRHIGVSVGSAWTWLSGGTSVTSVSNIPLTVCSSPSSNRSIGPSSPIAYGLSASLPRRRCFVSEDWRDGARLWQAVSFLKERLLQAQSQLVPVVHRRDPRARAATVTSLAERRAGGPLYGP